MDPNSKAYKDVLKVRGKMSGRPIYDHAHSPARSLSPSRGVPWRGWAVDLATNAEPVTSNCELKSAIDH